MSREIHRPISWAQNAQLLLVEDDEAYLLKATECLDRFGYQHISTARHADEAKAKLDAKLFDVIVADMRLGEHDDGFAVLDEVKKRNITSVLIILAANESVADCRRAFKEGAWDYISKNSINNVFIELDKSICEALAYFEQRGKEKDEAWIEKNLAKLWHTYGTQYIAVMNNCVIATAESEKALKQQLREKKYPFYMPIIKKIERLPEPSIADLIKQGESATLEFKRSLHWDGKRANKDLPFAVLKTIAAFLNSAGGTLLIGVADDGTILGLAGDLSLEKGGTQDEFEQTLRNLINDRTSAAFSKLINVHFEDHEGKKICVVEVTRAAGPVFMKGQRRIEFYVRDRNMSRALEGKEISHYIRTHWKK